MEDTTLRDIAKELWALAREAEDNARTYENCEWYYGRATALAHAARLVEACDYPNQI